MKTIKIIPGMLLIADEIHLTVSINTEQVTTIMPSNDQYGSFRYVLLIDHIFNGWQIIIAANK